MIIFKDYIDFLRACKRKDFYKKYLEQKSLNLTFIELSFETCALQQYALIFQEFQLWINRGHSCKRKLTRESSESSIETERPRLMMIMWSPLISDGFRDFNEVLKNYRTVDPDIEQTLHDTAQSVQQDIINLGWKIDKQTNFHNLLARSLF